MVWKPILGYDGLYEISNNGIIKSLYNGEKILNLRKDKDGYFLVSLYKNHIKKDFRVHRLVAQTFIDNPNNYPQINHKDGNKQNNNWDNLEWCNNKMNINHAVNIGLIKSGKYNIKRREVIQYDLKGNFIKKWDCINDVSRHLFIFDSSIIKCCQQKQKTAGGYIWRYANE